MIQAESRSKTPGNLPTHMTQQPPHRSKLRSWVIGLLVGIPLIAALAIVVLFTANLRILVAPLLAQSEQLVGRAIQVSGGVYLDIWPQLGVRVEGLEIANAGWAAAPQLATVESVMVALDVSSLRKETVRLSGVAIDGATLNLERNADGVGNWVVELPSGGANESSPARSVAVDKLTIAHSHLSYRDADVHSVELEIHKVILRTPGADALSLDAKLSDEVGPITALARLGPVSRSAGGSTWPLRVEVDTAYGAAKVEGEAPEPWDWANVAASFELDSHNLTLVQSLLDVTLPDVGNVEAHGEIALSPKQVELTDVAVEAGSSSAEAQITVEWSSETPTLSGAVSSPRVALEELLDFPREAEPGSAGATVSIAKQLDRVLRAVDARLELSASEITGLESTLGDASLTARTQAGTLTVQDASATVGKRRLKANARLWVDGAAIRVEGSAKTPKSAANTTLQIVAADQTVAISGEAAGDELDVNEIVALVNAFLPQEFAGESRVDVTLALNAKIQHAISKRAEARDASCKIEYANRELRITDAKMRTGPTQLSGATTLVFGDHGPKVSAQVDADVIMLGETLPKVLVTKDLRGSIRGVSLEARATAATWSKLLERADLEANAARASLRYKRGEEARSIPLLDGIRASSSPQHGLQVSTGTTVNNAPAQISISTLALHQLFDGPQNLPLKGEAQIGGTQIGAAGELHRLKDTLGAQFKVEIHSDNTDVLEQLLGMPLPKRVPITASALLTAWPGRLELADIRYESAGSQGTGALTFSRVGDRPTLKAALDFSHVEMPDFLNVGESTETAKAETDQEVQPEPDDGERLVPDIKFYPERLRGFDADVRLDIREATVGDRVLGQLGLTAKLDRGVLELERLHGTYARSTVEVHGSLDARSAVPDFRATGALTGIDYGEAFRARGVPRVSGQLDLGWDVYGQGADMRELVSTLDGTVGLVGGEGVLPNRVLQLWGGNVLRLLWIGTWTESEETKLNCIVVRWDLKDGVASTDALLVDTADMTIAGSGVIDLNTEQIEMVLKPEPKDPSLLRVSSPVRITGSLTSPEASLSESYALGTLGKLAVGLSSPAALVILFSDTGAGHENRCAVAIENQDARKALEDKKKARRPIRDFIDRLFGVK